MSYFTTCKDCGQQIELPAFEGDGVFSRDYPHRCPPKPEPVVRRPRFFNIDPEDE